jgi:hypothetical protein
MAVKSDDLTKTSIKTSTWLVLAKENEKTTYSSYKRFFGGETMAKSHHILKE